MSDPLPPEAPDAARALAKILGADMRGARVVGPFLFVDESSAQSWPSLPAGRLRDGVTLISTPRDEGGGTDPEDRAFADLVRDRYVWLLVEEP